MNEDYIIAHAIINKVCQLFKVDPHDVKTTTRKHTYLFHRLICASEIRANTGLKLSEIGQLFSCKGHCIIIYYLHLYDDLMFSTYTFKKMVKEYNLLKLN